MGLGCARRQSNTWMDCTSNSCSIVISVPTVIHPLYIIQMDGFDYHFHSRTVSQFEEVISLQERGAIVDYIDPPRSTTTTMMRTTLLTLLLLVVATPTLASVATCDEQAECIIITKERIDPADSSCPSTECGVQVCMEFNFADPNCGKAVGDSISHVCAMDIDDGADPTAEGCQPSPFQFTTDMKLGNVGNGTKHCVQVIPGEDAIFVLKDGNAQGMCAGSLQPWFGNPDTIPVGTTCDQFIFTNLDETDPDYGACSGGGNSDKECVWKIPTTLTDCDLPDEPPGPGVSGDPHFKTWHGHKFSYHGACDLILLHQPQFKDGLGLDIHIRSQHLRQFSYVTSAAVKIGDDVFVLSTAPRDKGYYLNREPYPTLPGQLGPYRITHKVINDRQERFDIHLDNGQTIVLQTWRYFISVKVEHPTEADFGPSVGIMGNFATGDRLARDGVTVLEDMNSYGQEWQVGVEDDVLFHTFALPQAPSKCELPATSTKRHRRLGEGVADEEARAACAGVRAEDYEFCVFDVLATEDVETAGAYR